MLEQPVIIWAASRPPSTPETDILAEVSAKVGGAMREVPFSALGGALVSALAQGPTIVVVDSRKDATAALGLGADEIVRVGESSKLRKNAITAALERARARARARVSPAQGRPFENEYPEFAFLMRILEGQLGGPVHAAARKCNELADELSRTVGVADDLMQKLRAQMPRERLKGWSSQVKDYARATLKAESLVSELHEQLARSEGVVNLLANLSSADPAGQTDLRTVVEQIANILRGDARSIDIEIGEDGPCLVEVDRGPLLLILCSAVENALENVRTTAGTGMLKLRVTQSDGEAAIEVVDNVAPGSTELRASVLDSVLVSRQTSRLRRLRDRVQAVGGELTVDGDEGTIVTIYLPRRRDSVVPPPPGEATEAADRKTHPRRGVH